MVMVNTPKILLNLRASHHIPTALHVEEGKEKGMYLVNFDAKFIMAVKLGLCNTTENDPWQGIWWSF